MQIVGRESIEGKLDPYDVALLNGVLKKWKPPNKMYTSNASMHMRNQNQSRNGISTFPNRLNGGQPLPTTTGNEQPSSSQQPDLMSSQQPDLMSTPSTVERRLKQNYGYRVDFHSRYIFPLAYSIFVFLYWFVYLMQ